ncbi:MAG: Glu-tRNA(Gln) amidotransferase subunit GatE [Candidatus Heimdallarchaeota archaeon]|nr:Glu-tRNA(Gln) amidotransferase subunit GatE [Candidatus Heimdallarchaeota archaeon]
MTLTTEKMEKINYAALGLKCGLELHQQLDTGRKLFCHCKSELRLDEPQATITRHMRPTLSEMGDYDKTALMEFQKQKEIIYEIHDSVCSYEMDETPPFEIDPNAVDLAITIAKLLQMDVLDELLVNRKQYLDGSIPSGFQRTMLIGLGGKIKVAGKTVNLDMLALEEDSCREISNTGREVIWRLDRLGTPLVEIATKTIPIADPQEIRDIAESIGRILRVTGKVKRGLGTIRQDLNISIDNGTRVEIKGIQMLDMLPDYVKFEVMRQLTLIEIKDELTKRKLSAKMFTDAYRDCLTIFKKTKSALILSTIKNEEKILGVKLPGMVGLLSKKVQGNNTFGKEIADRVRVITGLGGIFHTDELPNYGITESEVQALRELFICKEQDAVAIVIGQEQYAIQAIKEIIIRVKEAFEGVPKETRHARDDATTSFRRYLGGAGRMYPDTDSYPIIISPTRLKHIEEGLPELPEKREERYKKDYHLSEEIARNLAISIRANLFDELVKIGVDPMLAAITLEQTMKALIREEIPVDKLPDKRIKEIFELLLQNKIAKEALAPLLSHLAISPRDKLETAIRELGLESISEVDFLKLIDKILMENIESIKDSGERSIGKLMGLVMKEVRGKIDGETVNKTVTKRFKEKLKELGIT